MPRDGSGVFSPPAGTTATAGTTIESAKYNAFVSDLVTDANTPRPIVAGGTGATTAGAALTALGGQPLDADLTSWAAITRASGFDAFAATPSSANLRALLTDEVGTGGAYFVGGALGTPASVTLTNATGLPFSGLDSAAVTTAAEGIASNNVDTQIPTSAAVKAYVDSSQGAKAFANFNGVPVSGTYSRTGTLVTVTLTAHGMSTGQYAYLDFTSGTATDGYYQITSTGANTFTVVDAASGATSGNVTRNIWTRKSLNIASIVRQTTARYQATFSTAFADADYIFIGHAGEVSNRITEAVSINALGTLPTTTTVTFYAGDTGGNGVTSSSGNDNAYVHFVVFA